MRRLNKLGYLGLILLTVVISTSGLNLMPRWLQSVQLWLLVPLLLIPFGWRLSTFTALILGWSADVFTPSVFGLHMVAYPATIGLTALTVYSWHTNRMWLRFIGGVAIGSALGWLFILILEIIINLFSSGNTAPHINLAYLGWIFTGFIIHLALAILLTPLLIRFTRSHSQPYFYG